MKSAEFADTLNSNIKEYGNPEWSEWAYIKDGYPIQKIFTVGETEPTATPTAEPTVEPTATPTATPMPTSNPKDERSAYDKINFIDYNEFYTSAGDGVTPEMNYGGIMTRPRGNEQYVRFDNVDFGEIGAYAAEISARLNAYSTHPDYSMEICIDTPDNTVGRLSYGSTYTAAARNYAVELDTEITGRHTLYIKWKDAAISFYIRFAEGTLKLAENENKLDASLAKMRVSENSFIHEDSYGDGGACVQGIGIYGMADSVSFPAVDFGSGVSKSIKVRAARSNALCVSDEADQTVPPVIRIHLGGRDGEVIGETALAESSPDNLGIWKTYEMQLSETISGIHMITVEINYETKLRYVAFDYEEPVAPEETPIPLDGYKLLTAEQADSENTLYGTGVSFVSKYAAAGKEIVYNAVELKEAAYVTSYIRGGAGGYISIFTDDGTESAADISTDCWAFESVTVKLNEVLNGTHKIALKITEGAKRMPDFMWLNFMTEDEYTQFCKRSRIAAIGTLADRNGFTPYFTQMLDSEKYRFKNFRADNIGAADINELTEYAPDTAMIMFGGAEAAKNVIDDSFADNYQTLIDALKSANPDVKIYIMTPTPMQKADARPNYSGVIEELARIASVNDAEIIDLYGEMINFGVPMEYFVVSDTRNNLTDSGLRFTAKAVYNTLFPKENIKKQKYMLAYDADFICCGTGGTYNIGAFKNVTDMHIKTTAAGMTGNEQTVVMLKDVDMKHISSMTIEAASVIKTDGVLPVIECHLDSIDGEVIGRTVIFPTAQNTEYAFLPIKNSILPVTDGQTHNLFFVLNKGENAASYDVVNLKSIELNSGAATPAVIKDGVIADRNYAVNLNDNSKDDEQYKNGGTYTWVTAADDYNAEACFIAALYDKNGLLVKTGISETAKGRLSAALTLPDDFENGNYRLCGYIWQNGAAVMKPLGSKIGMISDKKIKIGLIGDSTTNNVTVNNIAYESLCYPNFLRSMSDTDKYEILNFGRGTATAGSYITSHKIWFELAKSEKCDKYFIMLGTNNAKGIELDTFKNSYQTIIDGLREANPDCEIYIMTPIPALKDKYMIEEKTLTQVIIPMVGEVARENNLTLIDMYSVLKNSERFSSMYGSDGIHENEEGMIEIAKTVKNIFDR